MTEVWFKALKSTWKNGFVVAAEFAVGVDNRYARKSDLRRSLVLVAHIQDEVIETIYGNVSPLKMYIFQNLKEAMEFVNADNPN
jgi:hypothetical protein